MTPNQNEETGLDATHPRRRGARTEGYLEGERRLATILFCDVQGSTSMAEQLDPEEWAEIMEEAFDFLIAPVVRYGGTVARLMGDGILAVFGAPVAHEDDPRRAILAALEIFEGIRPFQEEFQRNYRMDFELRIGINTGMVVVGEIGSDLATEWTAMGDAVNLAARMEQTAAPGTIQVSEGTYRLAAPLFDFEPLGGIEVKGKRNTISGYRVLGEKKHPGRLRGIPGLDTPLIGRKKELESLRQAFDQLLRGRGGILCLIGEAGLGKSRMIEEMNASWTGEMEQQGGWVEGRCVSFEASRPYGLFRQYLYQFCGVEKNDPPELAREKILCSVVAPDGRTGAAQAEKLSAVEVLLTAEENIESAPDLEGEALKRELFNEATHIFTQLAGDKSFVLVGDDLHWADPASIELLVHLLYLCEEIPILFLFSMRPHRHASGWQLKQAAEREYPHRYSEIILDALSDQESSALIDGLLVISELPEALRRLILRKTEGNPFFLEELVRELIESRSVVRDEGSQHWQAARQVEEIHLPESVHSLLAARIDRLEKEPRRTLQLASVIGRTFSYNVLKEISDPKVSLDMQLNFLERMGLIRETARVPEREYAFRHELTVEAAYESILIRRRRHFHRIIGEAIEGLYPDRFEDQAHLLAMHFDKALEHEKALKYYIMAGDLAKRLYANAEAIGQYSRAIQIARETGTTGQLITLYLNLGRVLENSGQHQEALANYRELESTGEARKDPQMQLAALIPQATLRSIPSTVFDQAIGRELSARALDLSRQLEDHSAEARSLWNMMLMEIMGGGNAQKAIAFGEKSLAISVQYNLKEEQAYALHDLARAYIYAGRFPEAIVTLNQAKKLWRELGNKTLLADSLGSEGSIYLAQGQFARAVHAASEGLTIAREIDNPWGMAYNQMMLGLAYFETGEIARSINAFEEANTLGKESEFYSAMVTADTITGWIYGILGDPRRGLGKVQELSGGQEISTPSRAMLDAGEVYLYLMSGELDQANQLAAALKERLNLDELEIFFSSFVHSVFGELALANGDVEGAFHYVERILVPLEQYSRNHSRFDLYIIKGKALMRTGKQSEGLSVLENTRRAAEAAEARRALWALLPILMDAYRQQGDEERVAAIRAQFEDLAKLFFRQIEDPSLRGKFLEKYQFSQSDLLA